MAVGLGKRGCLPKVCLGGRGLAGRNQAALATSQSRPAAPLGLTRYDPPSDGGPVLSEILLFVGLLASQAQPFDFLILLLDSYLVKQSFPTLAGSSKLVKSFFEKSC